jgi:hypothetical protein
LAGVCKSNKPELRHNDYRTNFDQREDPLVVDTG